MHTTVDAGCGDQTTDGGRGRIVWVTVERRGNRQRIAADLQTAMANSHPLKRLGTPQDVADVAAFLVSGEAGWITGVVIDVAGGAVMV